MTYKYDDEENENKDSKAFSFRFLKTKSTVTCIKIYISVVAVFVNEIITRIRTYPMVLINLIKNDKESEL